MHDLFPGIAGHFHGKRNILLRGFLRQQFYILKNDSDFAAQIRYLRFL
jgi:hypothetical protein